MDASFVDCRFFGNFKTEKVCSFCGFLISVTFNFFNNLNGRICSLNFFRLINQSLDYVEIVEFN